MIFFLIFKNKFISCYSNHQLPSPKTCGQFKGPKNFGEKIVAMAMVLCSRMLIKNY